MNSLVENIVASDLSESEICIPLHLQTWEFSRLILEDFEWLQLTGKKKPETELIFNGGKNLGA